MNPPLISLTTDFGDGPFAGIMKGVILGICPHAVLVDICHHVPPQDVAAGALVIEQALDAFPPGTVHLGVVDPGVGTDRRAMVLAALGMLFVGPDNGLFSAAILADPAARAWRIQRARLMRPVVSDTFHGRDIFAPCAAHLAMGLPPSEAGDPIDDPVVLRPPAPQRQGEALAGRVIGVDSFGNLSTNLPRPMVEGFLAGAEADVGLELPGRVMGFGPVRRAYGQAAPGEPVALYDSSQRLELSLGQGDLAASLAPAPCIGLAVRLSRRAD